MYIRYVGYIVSMTEWIIFLRMVWNFRATFSDTGKQQYLLSYRFLMAADFLVFLNLLMALLMSVPAINLYTHGTHITVAHAMGTTIGINTMILLGVIAYAIGPTAFSKKQEKWIRRSFNFIQASLLVFWTSLIIAGILKTNWQLSEPGLSYTVIMERSKSIFRVFSYSGSVMMFAFVVIIIIFIRRILTQKVHSWIPQNIPDEAGKSIRFPERHEFLSFRTVRSRIYSSGAPFRR